MREFMLNESDYVGVSIGTFEAPLGLIKIDFNTQGASADTTNVRFTMDTEIIAPC